MINLVACFCLAFGRPAPAACPHYAAYHRQMVAAQSLSGTIEYLNKLSQPPTETLQVVRFSYLVKSGKAHFRYRRYDKTGQTLQADHGANDYLAWFQTGNGFYRYPPIKNLRVEHFPVWPPGLYGFWGQPTVDLKPVSEHLVAFPPLGRKLILVSLTGPKPTKPKSFFEAETLKLYLDPISNLPVGFDDNQQGQGLYRNLKLNATPLAYSFSWQPAPGLIDRTHPIKTAPKRPASRRH